VSDDLARCLRERLPIPYEFPLEILREARVTERTERGLAWERLQPYKAKLLGWAYGRVVEECRAIGALPVAVFVPVPNNVIHNGLTNVAQQTRLMAKAGFVTADFSHLFDGLDPRDYMLTDTFHHMNASAHQLVADLLFNLLVTDTNINLAAFAREASGGVPDPGATAALPAFVQTQTKKEPWKTHPTSNKRSNPSSSTNSFRVKTQTSSHPQLR
jgi:hypothetical protein